MDIYIPYKSSTMMNDNSYQELPSVINNVHLVTCFTEQMTM